MRFQVPQFIEIEDKIFGPLTFKQFVYVAGGLGLAAIPLLTLPLFIAAVPAILAAGAGAALAFYTVNDRPLIEVIEAAVSYFFSSKLYLWKMRQRHDRPRRESKTQDDTGAMHVPSISQSKLKDLAWSLDVHESIYADTENGKRSTGNE